MKRLINHLLQIYFDQIVGEENYYCLEINDSTTLKFKLGYHDGTSNHLLKQDGTILEWLF